MSYDEGFLRKMRIRPDAIPEPVRQPVDAVEAYCEDGRVWMEVAGFQALVQANRLLGCECQRATREADAARAALAVAARRAWWWRAACLLAAGLCVGGVVVWWWWL